MDLWNVPVYYDYLDDIYCELIEYYFDTKEKADEFRVEAVEVHQMVFVCSAVKVYAPINHNFFHSVVDAVEDLRSILDQDARTTSMLQRIHREPITDLRLLICMSERSFLEEENEQLRIQLEKYETKNKNNIV